MFDNAMAATTQDSKYAVADILTTMAASHHLASAQSYLPVSSASVLTPTTLHNLEQQFDLDAVPSTAPTSGAYALPQTSAGVYYDGLEPPMKTVRTSRGLAIVSAPSVIPSSYSPNRRLPVRGQRGDALSADEEEKRRIRRERNKIAAAKCRQRRVDITNTLQSETDVLEDEKSKLEDEIKDLQREKEQLEFVMQAHRPMCRMEKVPQADRPMDLKVKAKPIASGIILPLKKSPSRPNCLALGRSNDSDLNTPVMNEGKLPLILPPKKSPIRAYKAFLSSDSQVDDLNTPVAGDTPVISRPGSLALKRPIKKEPSDLDTPNNPTGVLISTPSSGLPSLGLDGSTGLTPVMQEFTPPVAHGTTCASEVQRTSSSDSSEVTSPTLVSL